MESYRVADVQVAARLPALAVHSQRVADGGLHHEAVQRSAKDAVVVVAVDQLRVGGRLVCGNAIHNALHARAWLRGETLLDGQSSPHNFTVVAAESFIRACHVKVKLPF